MSVSTKSAGIVALLLASTLSVNALAAAVARITEVDAGGTSRTRSRLLAAILVSVAACRSCVGPGLLD